MKYAGPVCVEGLPTQLKETMFTRDEVMDGMMFHRVVFKTVGGARE